MGLCKTWTLDWSGLWTGLDWSGLNSCTPRLHQLVPSSASSCFLAVESSRHCLLDFERSKVTCIFNKLQQRWLWL